MLIPTTFKSDAEKWNPTEVVAMEHVRQYATDEHLRHYSRMV